jgi:hypothetical protein
MSQFEPNPYAGEPQGEARTSGMAVFSLVASLVGLIPCCPFLGSFIGAICGGVGMATIGGNPARKGKGLAATGLVIGLLGLGAWTAGSIWMGGLVSEMMKFVESGPERVLAIGAGGDAVGFKAECWGAAARTTDEEVNAFFDELEARYGEFQSCRFNEAAPPQQPTFGTPLVPFPYVLGFANDSVEADIEIAFSDPAAGGFFQKISRITVHDDERGDLVYPPAP